MEEGYNTVNAIMISQQQSVRTLARQQQGMNGPGALPFSDELFPPVTFREREILGIESCSHW